MLTLRSDYNAVQKVEMFMYNHTSIHAPRGGSDSGTDTFKDALECSAGDVFSDVIDFGYKVKSSRLSERLEALPPEEQEKAFAILDAFIQQTIK